MKIVINSCYGGFGVSEEAMKVLGLNDASRFELERLRTDEKLIALIEERGSDFVSDDYAVLDVVEIPDDATDWRLKEYDGIESITYVVDGKIYYIE